MLIIFVNLVDVFDSSFFVMMIALTVISREIVRAALANPVKSLRTE
jgi:hypothetical protein